jgi:hypothetical protein
MGVDFQFPLSLKATQQSMARLRGLKFTSCNESLNFHDRTRIGTGAPIWWLFESASVAFEKIIELTMN